MGSCDFESDVREIGDVDEGVVEGGEDACDAEDELACTISSVSECPRASLFPYGSMSYHRGPGDQAERSPAHRAQPSSWGP